jgi:DNA-directed RNA polymerase specialized sigma54-like protein
MIVKPNQARGKYVSTPSGLVALQKFFSKKDLRPDQIIHGRGSKQFISPKLRHKPCESSV